LRGRKTFLAETQVAVSQPALGASERVPVGAVGLHDDHLLHIIDSAAVRALITSSEPNGHR